MVRRTAEVSAYVAINITGSEIENMSFHYSQLSLVLSQIFTCRVEQILSPKCHFLCWITDDGQSQQTTESKDSFLPQHSNTISIPSKCWKDKNIFPKNVPPEFPFAFRWNTQNRYTQWYNIGLLWLKTVSFQRTQF